MTSDRINDLFTEARRSIDDEGIFSADQIEALRDMLWSIQQAVEKIRNADD
ncbi:MAG: hypothetical protein ACR2PS_00250 [Pseudomonadales bacterium]